MVAQQDETKSEDFLDEEKEETLWDFLEESDEGLDKADQLLIEIEKNGAEANAVHGLFRVFHTMKGMAAFLELHSIAKLAHCTEAILNQVRNRKPRPVPRAGFLSIPIPDLTIG